MLKRVLIGCLVSLLFHVSQAQPLAFPGAEGGGRFATGGRGGTVYEVTNLNDSGVGSLRDAISVPNRTVIFRVSGVIRLNSTLKFIQNNITVAGQTAPGDGICLTGYTVSIQASDIIIRHIRSRLGDETLIEDDAMHSMSGPYQNIIIDHCSLSWSVDETGTFYDIKNFTLQWCILSESLYHSVHDKGDHGYAGIWGGNQASFHHNLLAHHTSRNPRFNGSRYSGLPATEVVDFRNNVLYNWGNINSAYGGEGGNYNMVNNYYKAGPATPGSLSTSSASNKRNRILNYTSYYFATDAAVYPDTLFGGKFYIDGNFVKGYPDVTADNWTLGVQKDSYKRAAQLIAAAKQNVPFSTPPVTTQSAEEAYVSVLNSVGATFPLRDAIDARIIKEVQTGTATYEGATYALVSGTGISHPSGIIDTPGDAGGIPIYNSTTAPADADHDGMPDAWEIANGLNTNDASDRNMAGSDGYTNLEKYLNSLVSVSPTIALAASFSNFVQPQGSPSPVQSYTIYGVNLSGDIIITAPAGYEISSDGGTTWNSTANPLTLTQVNGVVPETSIKVRLNAGALGSWSGVIHHSTSGESADAAVTGITTSVTSPPVGVAVTVAKDGSGNFTTVQAAIDAAPAGASSAYIIYIKKGIYKEKIMIPSNKPFIQFYGESMSGTILTFDDYSGKAMPGGGTFGTANSASVTINATDFSAINITFENTTGDAPQALAINVNADRASFSNCRFLGGQDTVLTNGAGNRQYFKHCYIDGVVDFIFGSAVAVFDSCVVYGKSRADGLSASYITAGNMPASQSYGYVFRNPTLPSNTGVTQYYLGRPWQNSTGFNPVSYPRVVFLNATMGVNQVRQEGWSTWDAGTITSSIYYGEYKSKKFNGNPVNVSSRVNWSFQLTDPEAASYTNANIFGSWDPCALGLCSNVTSSIAVSNFKARKGSSTAVFTWNISWGMKDVKYELFRSMDNVSYSKINEQTAASDSTINFTYSESNPPAGKTFYYFIVASKAGKDPHVTPTITVSSTPTVTVTGALSSFLMGLGTPSAAQTYSVSGTNLTASLTITPPAGYEISSDAGTTWHTSASPIVLAQSAGDVASTSISVRLNGGAIGSYTGNISHTSGGALASQPVSGIVQPDALAVSQTIQYYAMTTNNQDDPASRAAGVNAASSSFRKLTSSNGTTVAGVPAYSATMGQAFGASTAGDGLWTVGAGGPGGNLNRGIYEQFTVTSATGYAVRVDSIVLKSSFYNTSTNTRFAVVYSKTGFTTADSTNVTGGIGPNGQALLSTANGAFTTPVLLTNETSGTATKYGFAFSGAAGVTISNGQVLTIRLYFSCGSTSAGRYAKVKDVYIKGYASVLPVLSSTGTVTSFVQVKGTPSSIQTYFISGNHLTGNVTIAPPAGFEVSSNGTAWSNSATPLVIVPVGGTLSSTAISVRLNSAVTGSFSGSISNASAGVNTISIAVTGNTTNPVTGLEPAARDFMVSPNPAVNSIRVLHPEANKNAEIIIYTLIGQSLHVYTPVEGSTETLIQLDKISSGLYLIEWKNSSQRIISRFIKQ